MAALNTRPKADRTNHEGTPVRSTSVFAELRRTVMGCMLWEPTFYENGGDTAQRIRDLVARCSAPQVSALAIEARTKMKLRHVPLLLCRELARAGWLHHELLTTVIQRPDEITEFLAMLWRDGRRVTPRQVKKGLAGAFRKFDEYALAKYDREGKVRLRDALFLCHAKAQTKEQDALWKRLIDGKLQTPDTWEVALSAAGPGDKGAVWGRLLAENKLGALALLRNLCNITEAGVPRDLIGKALASMKADRVLPFRFLAAARAVPGLEDLIEPAMLRCLEGLPKLPGTTVLLVDTSPSMNDPLSAKSGLRRTDAALGLAILVREVCEHCEIVAFSAKTALVPPRRGFALGDAIRAAVPSSGTLLGNAIRSVSGRYDRLVCITDEQSQDTVGVPDSGRRGYMVNVASYQNGVGYGPWVTVSGWSEAVLDFIAEEERSDAAP